MRQRGLGITWFGNWCTLKLHPGLALAAVGVHGAGVWLPTHLVSLHLLRLRVCACLACLAGPSALSLCGGHCGQEREKKAQSLGGTFSPNAPLSLLFP